VGDGKGSEALPKTARRTRSRNVSWDTSRVPLCGVSSLFIDMSKLSTSFGSTRGKPDHHGEPQHVDSPCSLSHKVERGTDDCDEVYHYSISAPTRFLSPKL
jgi:hypothetical protein